MRMVVKNQSHVSWRSIPRHFIRSLRVKFYAPFKQREFIDHVGSEEKHTVLTQIWNAEEHLSLIVLLYTLYHLKCPIVYNSRFNRVTSYTWKPVRLQYNKKKPSSHTVFFKCFNCFLLLLLSSTAISTREKRKRQKFRLRWITLICINLSLIALNPPHWLKNNSSRHTRCTIHFRMGLNDGSREGWMLYVNGTTPVMKCCTQDQDMGPVNLCHLSNKYWTTHTTVSRCIKKSLHFG